MQIDSCSLGFDKKIRMFFVLLMRLKKIENSGD